MPKDGSKQIRWWPPTLCWLLKFSGLNDGYGELSSSLFWKLVCLLLVHNDLYSDEKLYYLYGTAVSCWTDTR